LPTDDEWRQLAKQYGGVGNDSLEKGKAAWLEAHGIYWTASVNDPTTAPLYNFGKGSQALYRGPQGQKQMAVSVRCVRE
jgi:hypothetical protein